MMALAAISAMTITVSCDSDFEPSGFYSEVNVSNSYVSLNTSGGTASTEVYAENAWEIQGVPSWLTVSPVSGNAGQTTVNFSAESTIDGRSATLKLVSADKTQYINVIQGLSTVSDATCAEIIAGPDSKTYRAKGICTAIANTTYGNWYLRDDTGEIYIYGTLDKTGKEKNFLSLGIEVGDEITVEGPKTTYNGTVELVNVTVVKISKSLIKVDSLSTSVFPVEGGEIIAYLTNKGKNVSVNIPEEAKSWLSISNIQTQYGCEITFLAQPNPGGDRSTTIVFETQGPDDGKTYSCEVAVTQLGAILEVPVSDFLAAAEDDTQYRITGIITSLYASDKQGKSFTLRDYSGEVLIYRAEGFIESGAKVGDIVTVVGKRTSYKETPQMGTVTFEELKYPVTPVSIADFIAKEDSKEVYYMISGTVGPSVGDGTKYDLEQYGNFNLTDETGSVYIYGVTDGWGGAKGTFKNLGIVEGDKITIVAYKTSYKGLVEGVGMFFSKEVAE